MKTRLQAFYFCEWCHKRHDAELQKMRDHLHDVQAQKKTAYFLRQGKSTVLHVLPKR